MTRRALVVSSQIEGLLGADGDGDRVASALTARGFLIDRRQRDRATRAGLLAGFDELIAASGASDAVVVYYAGHGSRFVNPDPRAGQLAHPTIPRVGLFLVPTDYRESTDEDFRGLSAWELSARLAALTARTENVTVVLDCCHAAQVMRSGAPPPATMRALPRPHTHGVARYLEALRRAGLDLTALDPLGNTHAIRLFACGEGQSAWEFDTPAGRTGALTEAWLWALDQVGDAVVAWDVLGPAIRERVQRRFASQRPEIGGPVDRALFSTATVTRTRAFALRREGGRDLIEAGRLVGIEAGDTFAVVPVADLPRHGAGAATSVIATATRIGPLVSVVALTGGDGVRSPSPEGAMAVPQRRGMARVAVRLVGEGPGFESLCGALDAHPRLCRASPNSIDPVVAEVAVNGDLVTLRDEQGSLSTPLSLAAATRVATDTARDGVVERVAAIAIAASLRALDDDGGLAPGAAEVAWGTVTAGQLRRLPPHGATLTLHERVALRIENRTEKPLFAHVFDVGVRGQITALSTTTTTGVPIGPGAGYTLGAIEGGGLTGLALAWPDDVPRDQPRREEIVTIVTTRAVDLRILASATRQPHTSPGPGASELARLCAQLCLGGHRSAAPATDEAYRIFRQSFWLAPKPEAP